MLMTSDTSRALDAAFADEFCTVAAWLTDGCAVSCFVPCRRNERAFGLVEFYNDSDGGSRTVTRDYAARLMTLREGRCLLLAADDINGTLYEL